MKTKLEKETSDLMHKNPSNWKAGIVYFNPADPRIMVPKRFPVMGWTLNFASPYTYLTLIGIVAVIIVTVMFGK